MEEIFGLGLLKKGQVEIPEEIKELAEERGRARNEKNWSRSDELREDIKERGWTVNDGKDGWKLERVKIQKTGNASIKIINKDS